MGIADMGEAARSAFGSLLRRYRRAAGLTQEDLAERAELSVQAISALERGVRQAPYRDTVAMLAGALALDEAASAALQASLSRIRGSPSQGPSRPEPSNLPRPATPLIGRDGDVAAIVARLTREEARLVTVNGPGGVGKTRLALEAAREAAASFRDGATFVSLAPVRAAELVADAILRALGEREQPGIPPLEAAIAALGERHRLLLLDNFEHLTEAASHVAMLLERCPHVRILVTSRAALRLRGEYLYPVAPLEAPNLDRLPPAADLARVPAMALLLQRAQAAVPGFALDAANASALAAICHRLDGLPLALELAAPRLTVLAPHMLLRRLERRLPLLTGGAADLPERQRTMRATIEWSYELLGEAERMLFERLASFVGGCTLEATEAVGGEDERAEGVILDHLEALVAKSLLLREDDAGEPRFAMLETIREFALERLAERADAAAVRTRHAGYYLALAEMAEPALTGPDRARWMARLARERDNLRAALVWVGESGALEMGLRLAGALWRFWYLQGHLREGRSWLDRLLEAASGHGDVPALARAKALQGAAALAWAQGAYDRAAELAQQSLALYRETGSKEGIATTLQVLAQAAALRGDLDRAALLFEESLDERRALGDVWGLATALNNLGVVARQRGDFARAAALYDECLASKRSLGDQAGMAAALNNLGDVALELGEHERARGLLEECLALRSEPGVTEDIIAAALTNLGLLARRAGERERAQALLEEALSVQRELGARGDMVVPLATVGHLARERGDLQRAAMLYREALDLASETGERAGAAQCLEGLAATACRADHAMEGAMLYGAAAALRETLGTPPLPGDQAEHEAIGKAIRRALGAEAAQAAWAAGHALSLEQAVAMAAGVIG